MAGGFTAVRTATARSTEEQAAELVDLVARFRLDDDGERA